MKEIDFESMMRGFAEAKAFIEKKARDGFVVHEPAKVGAAALTPDAATHEFSS